MVNYWIIALPREDMEQCIKVGTFGLNRKYLLGKVEKGDKVVCYATKENRIIGIGEVTKPYYMDNKKIFKADGLFPDRIDFNAKSLSSNEEIDIKSLVDDLIFITNKVYWTVFFKGAIKQIPKKDWDLINSKIKVAI